MKTYARSISTVSTVLVLLAAFALGSTARAAKTRYLPQPYPVQRVQVAKLSYCQGSPPKAGCNYGRIVTGTVNVGCAHCWRRVNLVQGSGQGVSGPVSYDLLATQRLQSDANGHISFELHVDDAFDVYDPATGHWHNQHQNDAVLTVSARRTGRCIHYTGSTECWYHTLGGILPAKPLSRAEVLNLAAMQTTARLHFNF